MKTTLKILSVLLTILIVGCATTKNYVIEPVCSPNTNLTGPVHCLLVPILADGEDIILDIKNTENGTTKAVTINGLFIKNLKAGEYLYMRFTKVLYDISPNKEVWTRESYRHPWQWVTYYRVTIKVDVIAGKSKQSFYSKEFWVNDENIGDNTIAWNLK